MAPKRSKLDFLQSPPPASSSEHSSSHEDDDEEEESSSSEDLTPQLKPAAQKPHSGSESESESEPEETPRSVPEPVASKPVKARLKSKPSPKAPTPATAKRPAETLPGKKKSKKAKGNVAVQKLTVRVWSEEEEVAILKGMIDYAQKIGSNPSSDMEAFHAFVKKSLHGEASRSQLYDKVRRLKRKYWDNFEKLKKNESVRSSWKTHEKKLFGLSKKIWRSEDNGMHSEKSKSVRIANQSGSKPVASLPPVELEMSPAPLVDPAKDTQEMECEKNLTKDHLLDKKLKLGNGDVESYVMGKGLDLIEGSQRAELEERWANLHKAELKVFVERTKLILDQAKLVLAANK